MEEFKLKKKVLFIMYNLELGGAEKSLISILNNMDYTRYEIDLFLYEHSGELIEQLPKEVTLLPEIKKYATLCGSTKKTFKDGYIRLGIVRTISKYHANFRKLPLAYDQYLYRYGSKLMEKLSKEYDTAISNIWPHNLVVEKVKARRKIGWIHTDYSQMKVDYDMDFKILNKLDLIVAVSNQCKEVMDKIYPQLKSKIVIIENIVLKDVITKLAEEPLKEINEFKSRDIKLLTVARLHPEKGVDRAVEAAKKLKDEGKNFKWFIIGYGAQEKELLKRVKELGIEKEVRFLGKKINPYPYFKSCDIYVQPSRYEGKAITITEAKLFNKPIVITDYNSAKDQIDHGKNGLVVENSTQGIYEGIKELMENATIMEKFEESLKKDVINTISYIEKIYSLM